MNEIPPRNLSNSHFSQTGYRYGRFCPFSPVPLPYPLPSLGEATIRAQNDLEDAVAVSEEGVGANC